MSTWVARIQALAIGRALLSWTVCAGLSLAVTSCGGGDSDSGKSPGDTVDIFELQDSTTELLDKARDLKIAKVDSDLYDKITADLDKAQEAITDGDENKARSVLKLATKKLKTFLSDREALDEAITKIAGVRKDAEDAKKKADLVNAQTLAKDTYSQAAQAFEEAVAAVEKAESARAIGGSRQTFQRATTFFTQAAEIAKDNEAQKARAEQEKVALADWKGQAEKLEAKEKAPSDWAGAAQVEREADDLMARGDFVMAVEAYKDAARRFTSLIEQIRQQEALDAQLKAQAEQEKQLMAQLNQGNTQPEEVTPVVEGAETEPSLDLNPPSGLPELDLGNLNADPSAALPGGSIDLFDGYDPSQYPQELDAEDAAFLEMNYKKLVNSGLIQYDPATGAASVEYVAGEDMRKDLMLLNPKSVVQYKSPFASQMARGPKGMPVEERRENAEFAFAGNTIGFVAVPVPFKYYVRVNYDYKIDTMDKNGNFVAAVMVDPKKFTGYAAQWMNVGVFQRGGVPKVGPAPPAYSGLADRWFDKTRSVPMEAEFRMPDPEKGGDALKSGRFTITYDAGGTSPGKNFLSNDSYTEGWVAFQWSRVKFQVQNLVITGVLDKKAAVEQLREKLGVKKSK